jgi:hypothetical protein
VSRLATDYERLRESSSPDSAETFRIETIQFSFQTRSPQVLSNYFLVLLKYT